MPKEKCIEWSQLLTALYQIMDYDELFVKEQKSGAELHIYITDKDSHIRVIRLRKDGTWDWVKDDEAKK